MVFLLILAARCPYVARRLRQRQKTSEAYHRQDLAPQIGETLKASRAERHMGETWHPNDLTDIVEPEALRPELVRRFAAARGKDRSFSRRRHGITPV